MKRYLDSTTIIATLCVTALFLLAAIMKNDRGFIPPAVASGMTASSGEYVVTVGSTADRDEELVYIFDSVSQAMNSYRYDFGKRRIDLVQQLSLEEIRKATQPQPAGKGNQPKSP